MTHGQCKLPRSTMPRRCDDRLVYEVGGPDIAHERVVTIVFTVEQIAYLDERMAAVHHVRQMSPVGGSSLRCRSPEGLAAS